MSKFYLTTPIYYVNDKPHIGHAYTTIVADALARYHRLRNEDVFLVTGTDENSQKNIQAMEKAGEKDLTHYLDEMAGIWKTTWKDLGITFDDFIRTTEERHERAVVRFWKAVEQSGDIELREYEGWYCGGCEAFKAESDIVQGVCPLHPNRALEKLKERNYFFKLSNYRDQLLALYDQGSTFVMPETRRHEIRNYVDEHMADLSISREAKKVSVGIPVPGDDTQRIYVWFDALINYLSVIGYGTDDALFSKWWPANLHLVGKDIIKFHCALWPAMLMSAAKHDPLLCDEAKKPLLPAQVYAHGFFTIDGQKISKSLGNAIDPRSIQTTYGEDTLRYYLLREITFGEDGDFSFERLKKRYETDLGNTLGNLVNRVIAMSKKYFDGKAPDINPELASKPVHEGLWHGGAGLDELRQKVEASYALSRCDKVLEVIWDAGGESGGSGLLQANKYIEETQPFKLIKTDPDAVARILYSLLESCRWYAWLVAPVLPKIADLIWQQLGLSSEKEKAKGWKEALRWGGIAPGSNLGEPKPLFPRIEAEK